MRDFAFSFIRTSVNWRFPVALQVIFALLLVFGVYKLPESPRWLMHEGRHIDAQRVIAALNDDTYNSEATIIQTRLIMQSIDQSHQLRIVKKRNMFTNGPTKHFRRMWPVIFEKYLGLDRRLSLILGGVNVTVYAMAVIGSYSTIETFGRRKMFLVGTWGQMVSMVITFACLIPGTPQAANGAVFGLFLFLFFFGSTWLELLWLYSEAPLRHRLRQEPFLRLAIPPSGEDQRRGGPRRARPPPPRARGS